MDEQLTICDDLIIVYGLHEQVTVRETKRQYILKPAGICVINPLTFFQLLCPPDAGAICIRIPPAIVEMANHSDTSIDCYEYDASANNAVFMEIRHRLAQLFRIYFQENRTSELISQTISLVSLLFENFSCRQESLSVVNSEMQERMEKILRFIHSNWREAISLTSLASEYHLSESYISRLFRKTLDCTFIEYLTNVRMDHAHDELIRTRHRITDIAYGNGFSNINSFTMHFKQRYSSTPRQYRALYAQNLKEENSAMQEERSEFRCSRSAIF